MSKSPGAARGLFVSYDEGKSGESGIDGISDTVCGRYAPPGDSRGLRVLPGEDHLNNRIALMRHSIVSH
jgi:hypothetical protein